MNEKKEQFYSIYIIIHYAGLHSMSSFINWNVLVWISKKKAKFINCVVQTYIVRMLMSQSSRRWNEQKKRAKEKQDFYTHNVCQIYKSTLVPPSEYENWCFLSTLNIRSPKKKKNTNQKHPSNQFFQSEILSGIVQNIALMHYRNYLPNSSKIITFKKNIK